MHIDHLPIDVLYLIFSHLTEAQVAGLRRTCKKWNRLSRSPLLLKINRNLTPPDIFMMCCKENLVLSVDSIAAILSEPFCGGWHPVYAKREMWNNGMIEACENNSAAVLAKILKYGPNKDRFKDALLTAVEKNYISIVTILLKERSMYTTATLEEALARATTPEMSQLISNAESP